jgi:hypothetical protein
MTISGTEARLDGLALTRLPEGLGTPSDFASEWEGVDFTQRVWETQVEDGAWRVDLQVQVMRASRFKDLKALQAFLAQYHERGDDWRPEPFGDDGLTSEREVARLIEPGLAVEVRDPFGRMGVKAVKEVAEGIRLLER